MSAGLWASSSAQRMRSRSSIVSATTIVKGQRLLEHASRGLVDETGEVPDIVVGNPQPGEHHHVEATSTKESASEEGHRQEPTQTGAGVALLQSCLTTGPVVPTAASGKTDPKTLRPGHVTQGLPASRFHETVEV